MGLFSFFKKEKSSTQAKDRLKLVLIHDRAVLPPKVLMQMKNDLIEVISKYVEIDNESPNIEIRQEASGREVSLIANIPIKLKK